MNLCETCTWYVQNDICHAGLVVEDDEGCPIIREECELYLEAK